MADNYHAYIPQRNQNIERMLSDAKLVDPTGDKSTCWDVYNAAVGNARELVLKEKRTVRASKDAALSTPEKAKQGLVHATRWFKAARGMQRKKPESHSAKGLIKKAKATIEEARPHVIQSDLTLEQLHVLEHGALPSEGVLSSSAPGRRKSAQGKKTRAMHGRARNMDPAAAEMQEQMQNQCAKHVRVLKQAKARIAELTQLLNDERQANATLQQQLSGANSPQSQASAEDDVGAGDQLRALQETAKEDAVHCKAEIADLTQHLERCKLQFNDVMRVLEEERQSKLTLRQQLQSANEQSMQGDLQEMQEDLQEVSKLATEQKEQVVQLTAELEQCKQQLAESLTAHVGYGGTNDDLKQVEQKKLKTVTELATKLVNQNEAQQRQIEEMEIQYTQVEHAMREAMQSKHAGCEEKLKDTDARFAQFKRKVETDFASQQSHYEELLSASADKVRSLGNQVQSLGRMKDAVTDATRSTQQLNTELKEVQNMLKEEQEMSAEQRRALENCKKMNGDLEEQQHVMEMLISDLKKKTTRKRDTWKRTFKGLAADCKKKMEAELQQQTAKHVDEIKQMEDFIKQTKIDKAECLRQLQQLQSDPKHDTREVRDLRDQIGHHEDVMTQFVFALNKQFDEQTVANILNKIVSSDEEESDRAR